MVRHAGLDRGRDDAGLAVAVRRHDALGEAGHLHDRPQLADGELLVDRVVLDPQTSPRPRRTP